MAKPEDITRSHHRTTAEIKQAHPWISERAQELREVFGGYAGLVVTEDEPVFSWERKEPFRKPTNLLPKNREPHLWNAGIEGKKKWKRRG